jgi:hypothetical protein
LKEAILIPVGGLFIYFMAPTQELRSSKINAWQLLKDKFPLFVFGFVFVWGLNCLHMWPQPASEAMEKVINWSFTLCFVGPGLQAKLGDLKKAGPKGVLIGYVAGDRTRREGSEKTYGGRGKAGRRCGDYSLPCRTKSGPPTVLSNSVIAMLTADWLIKQPLARFRHVLACSNPFEYLKLS